MRARRPILLALAATTLGAAGCGPATTTSAGDYKGADKDVAQTVDDLATAARRGDARKICDSLLSAGVKAQLTRLARTSGRGTDCADQLKDSIRDADAFDLKVLSIKRSGGTATVQIRTKTSAATDPVDTLRLVDQRGWRIAALPGS